MTEQSDNTKIDAQLKLDPVWNILVPTTGFMVSTFTQHQTLGLQTLGFIALVLGMVGIKWHPDLHKGYRIVLPIGVYLVVSTYKFNLQGALAVLIFAPLWLWTGRAMTLIQRELMGLVGFMLFLGSLAVENGTPVWSATMAAVGIFWVTTIKLDHVKLPFWDAGDPLLAILTLCWVGHHLSALG